MNFPLISLPNFLLDWYPKLQELHVLSAEITGTVFALIGLLIIVLWAGTDLDEKCPFGGTVKNRMQLGFVFFGVAVLSCIFGLYFTGLLFVTLLAYVFYAIIFSVKAVFFHRTSQTN